MLLLNDRSGAHNLCTHAFSQILKKISRAFVHQTQRLLETIFKSVPSTRKGFSFHKTCLKCHQNRPANADAIFVIKITQLRHRCSQSKLWRKIKTRNKSNASDYPGGFVANARQCTRRVTTGPEGLGFNSQSHRKNYVMLLSVHTLRLISLAGKRVWRCPL